MQRLLKALSGMRIVRLKGDRDVGQIGARRGVIAHLASAIEKTRFNGVGPTQGRRLFTRDEAIALGALFMISLREVGMNDVVSDSGDVADALRDRLANQDMSLDQLTRVTEEDILGSAEVLSNNVVSQLEYETKEMW